MAGSSLKTLNFTSEVIPLLFFVKEPVFPFDKFLGTDPILGPEMRSTGKVMGMGDTFAEAYGKAKLAAGISMDMSSGAAFISIQNQDKPNVVELAKRLVKIGFKLFATQGTANVIKQAGIAVTLVKKVKEGRPHIVDMIVNNEIDLLVNTTDGRQAIEDSYTIRCSAVMQRIIYTTTMAGAYAIAEAMECDAKYCARPLQNLNLEKV